MNAPTLAAFQVLIYVGAVTVVILFGIMFTQKPQVRHYRTIISRQLWPGFFVTLGVGAFLAYIVTVQDWAGMSPGNGLRTIEELGENLPIFRPPLDMHRLFDGFETELIRRAVDGSALDRAAR